MARKYNGLNSIKIDLAQCGICKECGRRFTDPLCTHATAEQIEYTKTLDAQVDAEYNAQNIYRNRTIQFAPEAVIPFDAPDPSDDAESDRIQKWLSDSVVYPVDEQDCTQESPIISGGEICYHNSQTSPITDDEIPF